MQTANRLANGNTVICNWIAGNNRTEEWDGTVQVFEVTPDKKVVWAFSNIGITIFPENIPEIWTPKMGKGLN